MTSYQEMSKEQLLQEKTALKAEYAKIKEMGLSLSYVKRRACKQSSWDLSMGILDTVDAKSVGKE